jgi:rhamnosyltransferase
MADKIAVIIRTKNSEEIILQTLKALFSQDLPFIEVLLVDSESRDKTLELARQFPCRIISIKANDYYPGKVLNEAIANTSAPVIVFLNSDAVLLTPHSLASLVEPFGDPQVQATYGRQICRPEASSWVRKDYSKSFPTVGRPSWVYYSLPIAAMRRSIWERRPFYTEAWGSEDTEWGHWASENGYSVEYVPEALVMHSHNYTLRQLYGRRFIEGEADGFIFKQPYGLAKACLQWLRASASDLFYYIKVCDWVGIPLIPIRRFVYFWAYAMGHRLSLNRQKSGNRDASIGQQEVLKRYE